jgi:hypothetical protein
MIVLFWLQIFVLFRLTVHKQDILWRPPEAAPRCVGPGGADRLKVEFLGGVFSLSAGCAVKRNIGRRHLQMMEDVPKLGRMRKGIFDV